MPKSLARMTIAAALALASFSTDEASGQCMQWDVYPGFDATAGVRNLRVLDIGSGPKMFVAAGYGVGQWTRAGWGQSIWSTVGGQGFDDVVHCVGTYNSGSGPQLYAGGQFSETGITHNPAFRLAKLVNQAWVGWGIPAVGGIVYALTEFDDGFGPKLFIGGGFQTYSSLNSLSLVTWNGTAWGGVGGGLAAIAPNFPIVNTMCVFDDGTGPALYVAGHFTSAGGITVNHIAKWNGTNWAPLGSGVSLTLPGWSPRIAAMTGFDDGTAPALYVCGLFDHAGGVSADSIAKWDGANWSAVPGISGTPYNVQGRSITSHDDGNGPALYVGIDLPAYIGQSQVNGVARWDGQSWSGLGGGFRGFAWALGSFDDSQGGGPALWIGGDNWLPIGGNLPAFDVARWYGGCTHGIDPFCFGDGTFAPCPCANYGSSLHGCANSASSQGAQLTATGTTTPDTLVLQSSFEPATCLSIFVQSSTLLPVQIAFGDGILCLGGQLSRLYVKTSSAGVAQGPEPGEPSITQVSAALGDPIAPGSVRYYQVWYRDGEPTFCTPASFNVSNGLRVVW